MRPFNRQGDEYILKVTRIIFLVAKILVVKILWPKFFYITNQITKIKETSKDISRTWEKKQNKKIELNRTLIYL